MLDTPQITQTAAQLTAIIRLTVPREEIRNVMGPGIGELMAAIAAQGIAPAGPWFNHHLKMDPAIFDFEISVPVTTPVAAVGRVKPSQWPAMKVARTIYHGAYHGLSAAWGEFDAWIAAKGHTPGPDLWECYVTGPEYEPRPGHLAHGAQPDTDRLRPSTRDDVHRKIGCDNIYLSTGTLINWSM